jgi:hypothetical protein
MAELVTPQLCCGSFQALPPDVLHAIVRLLSRGDRSALRLVQRRARELVNGLVAAAETSYGDVVDGRLALHRAFPNLARLRIGDGRVSDASFVEFAASTLQQLTGLTSLDLKFCDELGAPTLSALAVSAPQLQALQLPGDGRRRRSCGRNH